MNLKLKVLFIIRCYVCQQATLTLSIDVNKTTIATLVSRVLCDSVGFNQVCFIIFFQTKKSILILFLK